MSTRQPPSDLHWRAAILLAVACLFACHPENKLLAMAKDSQSKGDMEEAIGAVEELVRDFPDSEATQTGRELAADWLVTKALQAESPDARTTGLARALEFQPNYGQAHLELCRLTVSEGDLQKSDACLGRISTMAGIAPEARRKLERAVQDQK